MKVSFNSAKTEVEFYPLGDKDTKVLDKFPGLIKNLMHSSCPAILPVAYNLIKRIQALAKSTEIDADVAAWIKSPFKLKEIPAEFRYITTPKDFQEIALRFAYTLGSAGILLDPGMGKSKVVLDYIVLAKFTKSIIVCPKPLLFVWEDEIKRHRHDLSYYVVKSTDWEKEKPFIDKAEVTIINYDKCVRLKYEIIRQGYQFIHLDEFLIKDNSTQRTQSILQIAKHVPFRMGGSGTLINNTPLDAFAPIRYLQPSLVGWNYGTFMDRYTIQVKRKEDGRKLVVGYKNSSEIRQMLESCCIVMTKERWLKLPPKTFTDHFVQMGPIQKAAYYQLLQNYNLTVGGKTIMVDNPLVMMAKLNQISNGFIYITPEEEGVVLSDLTAGTLEAPKKKALKREVHFFPDCGKVDKLDQVLTQTIKGKRAIIWFNMDAEFKIISDYLNSKGFSFLSIQGGDKNIGEKIRKFNEDPSVSYLPCQAKAVNYGVTIMGSKRKAKEESDEDLDDVLPTLDPSVYTEVFFSMNFSAEVYSQQQDRVHRLGQEHPCGYHRLFCNTPVEMKIRDAVGDKIAMRKEMLIDVAEAVLKNKEPTDMDEVV